MKHLTKDEFMTIKAGWVKFGRHWINFEEVEAFTVYATLGNYYQLGANMKTGSTVTFDEFEEMTEAVAWLDQFIKDATCVKVFPVEES